MIKISKLLRFSNISKQISTINHDIIGKIVKSKDAEMQ